MGLPLMADLCVTLCVSLLFVWRRWLLSYANELQLATPSTPRPYSKQLALSSIHFNFYFNQESPRESHLWRITIDETDLIWISLAVFQTTGLINVWLTNWIFFLPLGKQDWEILGIIMEPDFITGESIHNQLIISYHSRWDSIAIVTVISAVN